MNRLIKFALFPLSLFSQLAVFGSCIDNYPEKYNFAGRYVPPEIRKVFLTTTEKTYRCIYVNRRDYDYFNLKCSENIFLKVDGGEGNMTPRVKIKFNDQVYSATALINKMQGGQRTWFEQKQDCMPDYMREVNSVDYKFDEFDKTFNLKIDLKLGIQS